MNIDQFNASRFRSEEIESLREELGLTLGIPTIGFVGRITRDKGLHDLAAAVVHLSRNGTESQLLVVGREDDASGRVALDQLRATGLLVAVTGFIDDPSPLYQLMDVLCLPSYREGFPTVVLEASSSSIPVIVSDATGTVDAAQ